MPDQMSQFPAEYLAENKGPAPRTGMIVCGVVSTVVVLARVYARAVYIKSFGLDDWLIIVALLFSIVVIGLSIRIVDLGAGRHMVAILPNLTELSKTLVSAQLLYMITLWFCRISGIAFYVRLAKGLPNFNIWLILSSIFVTATLIVQLLLIALQCIPLKKLWMPQIEGKCLGSLAVFLPTAAITIICDAIVLLLPLAIVLSLKTSAKRKLILAVVMCFGVFAIITSIFRIISMIPATRPGQTDPTFYYAEILVWGSAEVGSAIIALSMPALKPLFGKIMSDGSKAGSGNRTDPTSMRMKSKGLNSGGAGGSSHARSGNGLNKPHAPPNDSEEHLWVN